MRRIHHHVALAAVACAAQSAVVTAGAQSPNGPPNSPPPPPPTIAVTATGQLQVAPDRARVRIGVETLARTAAVATATNNRKQGAILAALKSLGIPAAQITTVDFTVNPEQRYDEKEKRVVIDGYRVSNIVQVESDKLEQAGPIIDAGLSNGANRVAGLDFYIKDPSAAQDSALARAVASARRQAEIAARAAGGQIMDLQELTIGAVDRPEVMPMVAMARMADASPPPTPINSGTTTITVTVSTRWRYSKNP